MKRKKWIFSLGVLLAFGLSYAVATRSQDPLLAAVQKLAAQSDAVFKVALMSAKTKKNTVLYYSDDQRVDQEGKPYRDLIASFQATKKLMEKGFQNRQDGAIGKGKLKSAAMASVLYLDQQKRLYLNYLRNLHQTHASKPSHLLEITALNLKMQSSTALTLYFDDQRYQSRFNLWHVKSAEGDYETIEYGASPQDLSILEQQALQEVPSELNYGRLLQFMVSRERMINQWALNRMSGGSYDLTSYGSCGTQSAITSFKGLGHGDFYQNLWSNDRTDELLLLRKPLAAATFHGAPIVSEEKLSGLLMGYFNHWPDYAQNILPLTSPEMLETYRRETPVKALEVIETHWRQDAEHAILDVNFPSDAWDRSSLADRIAWQAYHYREKHLIDLLVNEATAQGILDVTDHPQAAWDVAEAKVTAALSETRPAYVQALRTRILAALTASDSKSEVSRQRMSRFQETLKEVKPGMERIAQADYVTRNVNEVLRNSTKAWMKSGLLVKNGKDFELAYLPAQGLLRDRVKLYTPDQLSQFFMKKLMYWDDVGGYFQTAGSGPNQVSKTVTEIKNNPVVMRGVQQFFGALADQYYERLKAMGPKGANVGPDNSPLDDVLAAVAKSSYQKFAKSLAPAKKAKVPVAKPATSVAQAKPSASGPAKLPMPNVVAVRDSTYVARPAMVSLAPKAPSNVVPASKRKDTLELYTEAMALMNIGELASGRVVPVAHPKLPYYDHNFYRITAPLDMEHVLNEQAKERNLADQLVRSLLDQKMAAELIKKSMLDQYPLLAIRDSNDLSAPRLGDKLVNFYTPRGLNFDGTKQVAWQAVQVASRNARGLVEESCGANPSSEASSGFKHLFDASKSIRGEIMAMDSRFEKYDETYRLAFRSPMEKFKDDWMDPICTLIMYATTIALAWYLAPLLIGGVSSMIALESFSMSAFTAGASGLARVAGAGGIKTLFATLLSGKATMLVNGIFLAQALVWGHVNCIELPAQLQYQLRVAQSQIGVYSKPQITDSEIERFNEEINVKKTSTYLMVGFQAIMIPSVWKAGESIFGFAAKGALKRMALVAGPESEVLVNEMKQLGLQDLTRQEGIVNGTRMYVAQKIAALKNFGRFNTLGSAASNQGLRELLTANAVEMIKEEPAALTKLYAARIESINVEGARIVKAAEKTTLLGKAKGGSWWSSTRMKDWVRNKSAQIGLKNTQYWKMVVADDALDAMLTGKVLAGANTDSEVRAMVLYAYARDLMHERDYLIQAKYKLDMWLDAGALEGAELLKQHFRVFGDSDWARHEALFGWATKQVDKPVIARINLRWSSQTRALGEINRAFKDYRTLRGELDLIQNRFWGWEAESYFANQVPEPTDIEVDANGYEVVKPLALPEATGGPYTEILFDPSGLLPAN